MNMGEQRKVLFVAGTDRNIEELINKTSNIKRENILFIQSSGPVISPFSDVMRDIIIAVYQENVDEIFVAAEVDHQKNSIIEKILENEDLQEKIKMFDYLFRNCMPEFPARNIREWLGEGTALKNSVDIIRHHPLMPPHVKVTQLPI